MNVVRPLAVGSTLLLAQAGCASTTYTPRSDGRIWTIVDGGSDTLVKDGQHFPARAEGLKRAVAGNPAAEEHARSYNFGMNLSLAEYLVGLGAVVTGFILQSSPTEMGMQQPISEGRVVGGVLVGIAGLGLMVVSIFQVVAARTHFQDAINIYNDGVPPRLPPPVYEPATRVPLPLPPGSPEVTPLPPVPPPDLPPPPN
jgi:hypothetical protein